MGSAKLVQYQEKEILLIDLSNCDLEAIIITVSEAKKIVITHPAKSLLTLTDVSNAHYSPAVTRVLKEFAEHNAPYVKAGAVVGVEGIRKVVFEAVVKFTGRDLYLADDLEGAKEWLVRR